MTEYVDVGNPWTDPPPEFECLECGKPIYHEGYCSDRCAKASMI